jgi:uncharacterized protein (DUF736 family)
MSETTKEYKKDVGAVWVKKDKNGDNFLTISLKTDGKELRFVAWKNKQKTETKHPSFRIYPDEFVPGKKGAAKTVEPKAEVKPAATPAAADGNIEL